MPNHCIEGGETGWKAVRAFLLSRRLKATQIPHPAALKGTKVGHSRRYSTQPPTPLTLDRLQFMAMPFRLQPQRQLHTSVQWVWFHSGKSQVNSLQHYNSSPLLWRVTWVLAASYTETRRRKKRKTLQSIINAVDIKVNVMLVQTRFKHLSLTDLTQTGLNQRKTHTDVQLKAGAHSLGSCLHWPTLFAEQQRLLVATPSTPVSRSLLLCNQQNTSQTKQCHPPTWSLYLTLSRNLQQ